MECLRVVLALECRFYPLATWYGVELTKSVRWLERNDEPKKNYMQPACGVRVTSFVKTRYNMEGRRRKSGFPSGGWLTVVSLGSVRSAQCNPRLWACEPEKGAKIWGKSEA